MSQFTHGEGNSWESTETALNVPLDGKAKLRTRIALPDESAVFSEAKNNDQPSDGLMLVYLVELDGNETTSYCVKMIEAQIDRRILVDAVLNFHKSDPA